MTDILPFALSADVCRLLGVAGFLTYVVTYAALCLRVITGDCTIYFVGNTLAAALVLISLSADFNLASVLIQGFWICIGLVAIVLRLRRQGGSIQRAQWR